MIWLWLAIMLAGWSIPAWRWLKRRRAAGWPIADSRIESVEVSTPTFSFKTKRGYYVAELGYSYSIAGSAFSGHYRQDFPTEREADEFVRDLQHGCGLGWHIFSHLRLDGREYREFEAEGTGGQLVIVVPELDLAVEMLTANYSRDMTDPERKVLGQIVSAIATLNQ